MVEQRRLRKIARRAHTWRRREEEKILRAKQGKGIARAFQFGDQDTLVGVITLRIGNRTIKRVK